MGSRQLGSQELEQCDESGHNVVHPLGLLHRSFLGSDLDPGGSELLQDRNAQRMGYLASDLAWDAVGRTKPRDLLFRAQNDDIKPGRGLEYDWSDLDGTSCRFYLAREDHSTTVAGDPYRLPGNLRDHLRQESTELQRKQRNWQRCLFVRSFNGDVGDGSCYQAHQEIQRTGDFSLRSHRNSPRLALSALDRARVSTTSGWNDESRRIWLNALPNLWGRADLLRTLVLDRGKSPC